MWKHKTHLHRNEDILKDKTVAEFFAGIGLMRMGLEKDGWRVVFANDIDRDKSEMYSAHFGECSNHFLLEDIHNLKPEQIPTVTIATASFPCNDLSLAGMRKGLHGKQSSAYWGFVRVLDKLGARRPPIVLLENVAGFLTSHGGRDFQTALLALNRLGYSTDAIIIDASRFVPQSRVRLFVIGVLSNGHANWEIQDSLRFYESDVRPKALAEFIFNHPEIVWNIRQLPPLPKSPMFLPDIIENLPEDSDFWWDVKRRDYLVNQMSEKHARQLQQMIGARKWSYGTVFRRIRKGRSMAELRTDGLAGCLRTPRGGSGRQILVQAGYGKVKVRLLTPRECARLMGANDFVVNVPLNRALFGFGDAVCVPVIDWISRNYLNPLLKEIRTRQKMPQSGHSIPKKYEGYGLASQRI
jgi:DNA (cytosine-5)-methyltransferase 1